MEKVKYCLFGKVEEFGKLFKKLLEASYSVLNCIGTGMYDCDLEIEEIEEREGKKIEDFLTEEIITKALVFNVIRNRPTGNGVGWAECGMDVSAYGVDYITTGGLNFGWDVHPEWDDSGQWENECTLVVYCYARPSGTLEESLIKFGFERPIVY